ASRTAQSAAEVWRTNRNGCAAASRRRADRYRHVSAPTCLSSAEPSNDAPHGRVCCSRCKKHHRGAFVGLTEGRIGRHHLCHGADIETLIDGKRPRSDQLTGIRSDDSRAEYPASHTGHYLDVTFGHPLGLGPIVFVIRRTHHANPISLLTRL